MFHDDYSVTNQINNLLYNKAKLYKNLFHNISIDFWKYFISILDEKKCNQFIKEQDIYCDFQIPITQFGIFLHNSAYDYYIFKLKNKIYNNAYDLGEYTEEQICYIIDQSTIALKALVEFVEKSNSTPTGTLYSNTNIENVKILKRQNKIKINILDVYRNVNCYLNNEKCKSFKHSCLLGHCYCANEYITQGCIISPKETNAILLSNNNEMLKRMKSLGMKFNKLCLSLCCKYGCLNSIYFLFTENLLSEISFHYIFYYWNNTNYELYLKSFEFIYTHFPHLFLYIQNYLTIEWFNFVLIDSVKYPLMYNLQKLFITYSKEVYRIDNHLYHLFNTSNYYKLVY
jgi:hypothetical protein